MAQPKLYERYGKQEAIAFFGSESEAHSLCDGQWIMLPNAAICMTTVGSGPGLSYFRAGSKFCWVAEKPYRVGSDPNCPSFLPSEVIGGNGKGRSIDLFVRTRESQDYIYIYIGSLGPSYVQQYGGTRNHGEAHFDLSPTLPSSVWVQLGGLQPGDVDHAAVDAALDRLRGVTSVKDRLSILQYLVQYWHGPIRPEDGMPDEELAGFRLPMPLRWWYQWAGRRSEIMSGQNFLFTPNADIYKLRMENDRLFFYVENQGVYHWATLSEGEDPPVFGRYGEGDPWEQEEVSLSEHLILACLFEAVMCHARYGASAAWLEEDKLNQIVKTIQPIAIGPWRWPGSMRFYARNGAFMYACGDETNDNIGYSVWIGAKTEHPLQFLKPHLDDSWEYVAI